MDVLIYCACFVAVGWDMITFGCYLGAPGQPPLNPKFPNSHLTGACEAHEACYARFLSLGARKYLSSVQELYNHEGVSRLSSV